MGRDDLDPWEGAARKILQLCHSLLSAPFAGCYEESRVVAWHQQEHLQLKTFNNCPSNIIAFRHSVSFTGTRFTFQSVLLEVIIILALKRSKKHMFTFHECIQYCKIDIPGSLWSFHAVTKLMDIFYKRLDIIKNIEAPSLNGALVICVNTLTIWKQP